MHQILFRLGLRPRTRWGDYSARPESLAGRGRPTSKEDEREGREKEDKERDGKK